MAIAGAYSLNSLYVPCRIRKHVFLETFTDKVMNAQLNFSYRVLQQLGTHVPHVIVRALMSSVASRMFFPSTLYEINNYSSLGTKYSRQKYWRGESNFKMHFLTLLSYPPMQSHFRSTVATWVMLSWSRLWSLSLWPLTVGLERVQGQSQACRLPLEHEEADNVGQELEEGSKRGAGNQLDVHVGKEVSWVA
jgi:hypothetical protein